MASKNETVAEISKEQHEFAVQVYGVNTAPSTKVWKLADRIEAAHKCECDKYKDHINELNRQILMLKHEREKRETYLCGYDPDEALVMQCSTCKFFMKKHSHCTFHDSLTNPKYKCTSWKSKTNRECIEEVAKPKRNCDRFDNGDDAFYAFDNECKLKRIKPCRAGKKMCTGHDSIHCFKDWLFSNIEVNND